MVEGSEYRQPPQPTKVPNADTKGLGTKKIGVVIEAIRGTLLKNKSTVSSGSNSNNISRLSPETDSPGVEVKYEGITPEASIITVDQEFLNQVLAETGQDNFSVRSFIITNQEIGIENMGVARYDLIRKAVLVNNPTLTHTLKRLHSSLFAYLEEPSNQPKDVRSSIKGFFSSKFYRQSQRYLNPVLWPYIGLKEDPLIVGEKSRFMKYTQAAKQGYYTTKEGLQIPLSKERAIEHMDKLFIKATQRYIGWLIAHETEHGNHPWTKMAVKVGTTLAPVVTAAILTSILHSTDPNTLASISLEGFLGPFIGQAVGRHLDEKASYKAGDKYFQQFARCFSINQEVFAKEVLGNKDSTETIVR